MSCGSDPARARSRRRPARLLAGVATVAGLLALTGVGPGASSARAATATTVDASTPKVCGDAAAFDRATKALSGLERGDLAGAASVVHEATTRFVDGSKRAPSGISADWKLMGKALTDLDAALSKASKAASAELDAAVTELIGTVQRLDADPQLIDASGRLQTWIAEKCNEVLSAVDSYTTTTSTTINGAKPTTTRKRATTTTKVTTTTKKVTNTRKGATTTVRSAKAAAGTTTGKTTKKK